MRTHFSSSSFSFQSTGRPFIRSLTIRRRRSNSSTLTGLRPTTRRDESPRPMPITMRPFVTSCMVAYQLAVIVGSRMPGFVTQWPRCSDSVCTPAIASVA